MNSNSNRKSFAWPLALAAVALIGTLVSACMMPFVAIAVASAATMTRAHAAVTIGGIWAINQILGFGLLGYPLTFYAIAWGFALWGASSGAMLVATRLLRSRRPLAVRLALAFAGVFIAYETGLFGFALIAGGTQTFTASIIRQIFVNDGLWFAGLMALQVLLTRTAPRVFGPVLSFGSL